MITHLFTGQAQIGTELDMLLAPLDDVAPGLPLGEPTEATAERAYALLLLACELSVHAHASPYFSQICRGYGVAEGDALTIARAFSSAAIRVSHRLGPNH